MTDVIFNKINESYIKLECEEDILAELYSKFSEYTPGYIFNPRYKMHIWDGKIHEISPKTGTMPIGLLTDCISYLKEKGYTYSFNNMGSIIDETIDSYIKASLHENMKFAPYPIRDYQEQAVYQALKYKKGILLSCTSSGKSLMIFNILKTLITKKNVKKAILIVPNITLVTQMFSDFKDYGWQNIEDEVTMLYGENKYNTDFRLPILITTWQSIQKKEKTFFEDYDAVIVDECVNGDTLILTPTGEKKIKDIKEGELVISYNEKTKTFEPNKVLEVHQNHNSSKNAKMLRLELEDGKILELTENHPVYTKNRGWVRAGDLTENDDIEIINNKV